MSFPLDHLKTNNQAQDFFDTHYKQTYGSEWHSIRLALFSKPKFAALVNNLSVKDEIIHDLKTLGCLSLKELYNEGKLQGVQGQTFMFQFTLRDKNMQVKFGLMVFWES